MQAALELAAKRIHDGALARNARQAGERCSGHADAKMSLAARRPCMTGVTMGFVHYFQAKRKKGGFKRCVDAFAAGGAF
jgi:hypothetical protein